MTDKIANTIALKQMQINELKELKKLVIDSIEDSVKFTITTKHIAPFMEVGIFKRKSTIDVSISTMNLLLDEIINKEKTYIDKLIDMEIEERTKKCLAKKNLQKD